MNGLETQRPFGVERSCYHNRHTLRIDTVYSRILHYVLVYFERQYVMYHAYMIHQYLVPSQINYSVPRLIWRLLVQHMCSVCRSTNIHIRLSTNHGKLARVGGCDATGVLSLEIIHRWVYPTLGEGLQDLNRKVPNHTVPDIPAVNSRIRQFCIADREKSSPIGLRGTVSDNCYSFAA